MQYLRDNSSSSGPSFKFAALGDTAKGTIVATPKLVDGTDLNTKMPTKTLVVELETEDGEVQSLWIRKGSMAAAVIAAVTDAGVDNLDVGGTLAVRYDSDGVQKNPAYDKPKLYVAQYKPPVAAAGKTIGDLLS
jgi:hypothetical protein